MNYIQTIHIEGKSMDDILRLPCVKSVEKTPVAGLYKFRFYPLLMAHPAPMQSAYTGDRLCQAEDGKWHVVREIDYKNVEV